MADVAKLLVVEDDSFVGEWFRRVLSDAGYSVTVASTFEAGRSALHAELPDLIIADVRLGQYNGLQIITSGPPGLPSIVITGFVDGVLEAEALRLGAHYIVKPVAANELLALIRHKLESRKRQQTLGSTRRWDRTRTGVIRAAVNSEPARLVDVSYGGLRLEIAQTTDDLRRPIVVHLATAAISVVMDLVWSRRLDAQRLHAGGSLTWNDQVAFHDWTAFVDGCSTGNVNDVSLSPSADQR
jgi:DNA-binding response OmpR family regulator